MYEKRKMAFIYFRIEFDMELFWAELRWWKSGVSDKLEENRFQENNVIVNRLMCCVGMEQDAQTRRNISFIARLPTRHLIILNDFLDRISPNFNENLFRIIFTAQWIDIQMLLRIVFS